jgi:S-adenosylmethionine decarboxylase
METRSTHVLIELWGCAAARLDDPAAIEATLRAAAAATGAHVITVAVHRFAPQGVAAVAVLAESHLSIHTWPEADYAAVDIYTCGEPDPEAAVPVVRERLGASRCEVLVLERGRSEPGASIRVRRPLPSA